MTITPPMQKDTPGLFVTPYEYDNPVMTRITVEENAPRAFEVTESDENQQSNY